MIISKIRFNNFMAYYKEVEFEFPLSDEKNVSIIYAPNDTGKSCFFKGILFCLYGSDRGQNLKDLVNINAFDEGDYESYVTIWGTHNEKPIQLTRRIKLKGYMSGIPKNNDFTEELDIWENYDTLVTDNAEEKYDYINAIVHEEAAKYFFFDGEKIEAYNIATAADYKEAITRILGIKEIENAREDFDRIQYDYEKDRDNILKEQNEAGKIIEEKTAIETELASLNKDCTDFENSIKEIKSRIVKYEEDLKNHEDIKEKIEEKQMLRSKEEHLVNDIKEVEKKKIQLFKDNGTIILGCKIADDIRRNLRKSEVDSLKFTMTESVKNFLQNLTTENNCICGNPIGDEEVKRINAFIENNFNENDALKKELCKRQAFGEIDNYIQHAANATKEYLDACIDKTDLNKELSNVQERLFKLKKHIGSFDEEAGERIAQEISNLEARQKDTERKVIETQTKIQQKQEALKEKEKELSKFTNVNTKCLQAEKRLRLAENIKNIFSEYLDELTKLKKDEVEQKATEIFLQLTNKANKYKGLTLTNDYSLKLELSDGSQYEIVQGRSLNPSTGQSKIISLAYIAGINQSSNSIAPIVIDNPVGLFSEEHRTRVMDYLPRFGKQVIFMVTKADLSDEYKQIIQPYVSCEYYLTDQSDTTWNKTIIAEKEVYYHG